MRSVRTLRTGLAAAVVAWKLAALALLPAALCCRAVMAAEGTAAPACCAGSEHGASCPMRGGAEETDAAPQQPRIAGCGSLDDALVGLLGLTGFTPDACGWTAGPERGGRVTEARYAAASLAGVPPAPPPRA